VVGLLPSLAAWGVFMAKSGLHAAGLGTPGGRPFSPDLLGSFLRADVWMDGALRLEQGFILSSVLLAAATVSVIERRFRQAAGWCLAGAALSAVGLIHSYRWTPADTVLSLVPAWPWALGYAVMAVCFAVAPWVTVAVDDNAGGH
jgi:AGZA family xanthine/uracil permease-like MFS transporter